MTVIKKSKKRSQSLRESGRFVRHSASFQMQDQVVSRNPFVNQVVLFRGMTQIELAKRLG